MTACKAQALILVGLSLGLGGVACGGSAGQADTDRDSGPKGVAPADGPLVIPPERLAQILEASSDVERPLLEDGVLTFDEYEQAIFASVACLEGAGLRVTHYTDIVTIGSYWSVSADSLHEGPYLNARGRYQYGASGGASFDPVLAEKAAKCRALSDGVDLLWAGHIAPTEAERQVRRNALGVCLRERGFEVPLVPSESDLSRLAFPPAGTPVPRQLVPRPYLECEAQTLEAFGF